MRRRALLLLLLLLATTTAACARPILVGSGEPGRNYRLEVRNRSGVDLIVRYDAGRGDALLGSVPNGATDYFQIAAPASTTITVTGVSGSGTRTSGPHTVTLVAGSTAVVTLR